MAAAGLAASDLDAVVLAGGGARVPLVAELLSGELGRPLVVGDDPR
ncbi:MAG: Hsp70 family protein [Actinomycetota bacterium]|nr:Hsp70 family protein [Actinomycetota bacterium]